MFSRNTDITVSKRLYIFFFFVKGVAIYNSLYTSHSTIHYQMFSMTDWYENTKANASIEYPVTWRRLEFDVQYVVLFILLEDVRRHLANLEDRILLLDVRCKKKVYRCARKKLSIRAWDIRIVYPFASKTIITNACSLCRYQIATSALSEPPEYSHQN